ncbi:hypothetical protein NUM3379_09100 [Kineococcus sp. NUM-3379]
MATRRPTSPRTAGGDGARRGAARPADAARPPKPGAAPAAGATRPPAAARGRRTPSPAERRRARGPRTLVLVTLLVVLGVFLVPSLQKWLEQRSQIAALRAGLVVQQAELERSRAEEARWDDPAHVMAQARARLQYVVPGEVPYVVDGPSSADDVDPADAAAAVPQPSAAWYANVWESLRVAGVAPEDELTGSVPAPGARPAPATTGAR